MNLLPILGLSLALGVAVGCAYFLTLWATVERLPRLQRPGFWMAASLLARLALLLAVLTLLARWGGWPGLLAALAGFLLGRTVVTRRIQAPASPAEPES